MSDNENGVQPQDWYAHAWVTSMVSLFFTLVTLFLGFIGINERITAIVLMCIGAGFFVFGIIVGMKQRNWNGPIAGAAVGLGFILGTIIGQSTLHLLQG